MHSSWQLALFVRTHLALAVARIVEGKHRACGEHCCAWHNWHWRAGQCEASVRLAATLLPLHHLDRVLWQHALDEARGVHWGAESDCALIVFPFADARIWGKQGGSARRLGAVVSLRFAAAVHYTPGSPLTCRWKLRRKAPLPLYTMSKRSCNAEHG